ncbi:MAG TPA: hypothetical protein VHF87_12740 [Methylomirabilota bacterium]|jgi:hypothetical protein|nr:hypothetical protein [Methylomirabilota bacterium]
MGPTFDQWLKLVSIIGAIGSFVWGVWVWQDKADKERNQIRLEAAKYAETRRVEAAKPFLDKQLLLFTEATQVASHIANAPNRQSAAKQMERFWQLYWGELALVERGRVSAAMVAFGNGLKDPRSGEALKGLALDLAHACRDELAISWGTDAWSRSTP